MIDAHDVKDGVSITDVRRVQLRAPGRRDAPVDEGSNHSCCSVSLKVLPKSTSGEFKFKVMSLLLGGADAQTSRSSRSELLRRARKRGSTPAHRSNVRSSAATRSRVPGSAKRDGIRNQVIVRRTVL